MARVAMRYAKALFDLSAGDSAKAGNYREAMHLVMSLFDLPESARILLSPVMPPDLKLSLLQYALESSKADADLKNLFKTLVDVGRVDIIPDLVKCYQELQDNAVGLARGDVRSAVPLTDTDKASIASMLGSAIHKRVEISAAVDQELLGGFIVQVGHYLVDLSLKTRLNGLTDRAAHDLNA